MSVNSKVGAFTTISFEVTLVNSKFLEDTHTLAIMECFRDSMFFKEILKERLNIEKISQVYDSANRTKQQIFEDALKIIFSIIKLNPKALDYVFDGELF